RRDRRLPGRALRRVRALQAGRGALDLAAVVRPGAAVARRRHRRDARRARAFAARYPRSRRRPGVVMALFVAIAAVLVIVVLAAVLWPLWRESRGVALAGVLAFAVVALGLYRLVGTPAAIDAPGAAATPRTMEEAVVQ